MGRQKMNKQKRQRQCSAQPKMVELWPVDFMDHMQATAYAAAYIRFKVDSGSGGDPFQGRILNYFIMADGQPVGIIACWRTGKDWIPSKVEVIFVHPQHQKLGIARRVVNLLVSLNPDVEFLGPLTADSEGLLRSMGLLHLMKTPQDEIDESHALAAEIDRVEVEACRQRGHRRTTTGRACERCLVEWTTKATMLVGEGFFAMASVAARYGFAVCQLGEHLEDEFKDGTRFHFTRSMLEKTARQMKADGVAPEPLPPRRILAPGK